MPGFLIKLLAVIAILYFAICVALFLFQRSLIYYPQPRALGNVGAMLELPVVGANLRVSVRPHDGRDGLLYFGGNAEDVSRSLAGFSEAFPDYAIFLLHYRGYGGSSGTPSEEALHQDALVLFDKVYAAHPNIVVVGRSLGTGVAIRLASQRPASRLILVTPYDSLQELAVRQFPYIPVRWLLRDKFESYKYVPGIIAPTLILAAENDEVISRFSTEKLYARFAPGVASLKIIPGTGHNSISEGPEYLKALRAGL